MEPDLLEPYLNRMVCVHFSSPSPSHLPQEVEGVMTDYSRMGILIDHADLNEVFIPFTAIYLLQIKQKSSLWERFMGAS